VYSWIVRDHLLTTTDQRRPQLQWACCRLHTTYPAAHVTDRVIHTANHTGSHADSHTDSHAENCADSHTDGNTASHSCAVCKSAPRSSQITTPVPHRSNIYRPDALPGQTCIWPSWCHCHSLSLAPVKSRLVLAFWYQLTWVVLDKGPLNGCVCVYLNQFMCQKYSKLCVLTFLKHSILIVVFKYFQFGSH